jgi:chemotaxis protein MotB
MANPKKKKKGGSEGAPDYMLTYGDMVTLLLTFFVLLLTAAEIDGHELRLILAAFPGLGTQTGGQTLQEGMLAELGNTIESLPSMERGRALDKARRAAISAFQPEISSQKVRIKEDERGLIISLAADAFFGPASATINLEESRGVLQRLSQLLRSPDLEKRKFRIEGHTDNIPTDPAGPWPTNWELSTERSLAVFRLLLEYGGGDRRFEEQFQIMGLSDTAPVFDNSTEEGRAYNRRVDVIILSEGHL